MTARGKRILLLAIEAVVGVNAYGGAWWGLAGGDVPREWLEGTPFDSYFIPSLILLIAIAGGMTAAFVALLLRYRHAAEISIAAGLVLVVWIATQVAMIGPNGGLSWLQPSMFVVGLVIAAIGWRLRNVDPTAG